jgi:phage tail sheath protein FI
MANFTVSPGVAISEIDNTFLTGQPVQAGAAIIGPTVKGPVEKPTLVTSYSDFQMLFGDSFISGGNAYSYLTSIAAYNYFNYGGTSLLVARVVTQSANWTPAESTTISSYLNSTSASFVLETISEGFINNNSGSNMLGSNGALNSGSTENVRWEVTNSTTGSGTFNVLIRRGNDTETNKVVLEAWNNLNLDPNSSRFISQVIGDQKLQYNAFTVQMELSGSFPNNSKFVRVKAVNLPTPNYFDANGVAVSAFTASLPVNGSGSAGGSFTGATGTVSNTINLYDTISTNTQGLVGASYNNMIALLGNPEAYQFNLLFTPGLINDVAGHTSQITNIILNTQNRGDSMFVVDLSSYGSNVSSTITQAQTRDTSYAAAYWPWVRIIDPATGKHVWVPASTVIPGVYAFNDKVSAPWFAPAGINRGGLSTVLQAELKLTQGNRDTLYVNNVNPIATLPKQGVVVFGQKTLQKSDSALDRVNVRRLMIELKNYIRQIADTIVFEQNTITTRNSFLARVNPYLEGIQQKQGLYAYQVIMDDSNNGPAVIDQNQLVGQIYIQPTRTAEFISLDFILLPTGAQFPI